MLSKLIIHKYYDNSLYFSNRFIPTLQSAVAPRPEGADSGPLIIRAEVTIENFQVDTPNMLLVVGFNLSLSWMESRAIYINLHSDLG